MNIFARSYYIFGRLQISVLHNINLSFVDIKDYL